MTRKPIRKLVVGRCELRRDRVRRWFHCHILRQHWLKFGTYPDCAACGKKNVAKKPPWEV